MTVLYHRFELTIIWANHSKSTITIEIDLNWEKKSWTTLNVSHGRAHRKWRIPFSGISSCSMSLYWLQTADRQTADIHSLTEALIAMSLPITSSSPRAAIDRCQISKDDSQTVHAHVISLTRTKRASHLERCFPLTPLLYLHVNSSSSRLRIRWCSSGDHFSD